MMHYANVVMEAKDLGFQTEESARNFARKVITTAALLAMMPEDVLAVWCRKSHGNDHDLPVLDTMNRLNIQVPEEVNF